MSVETIHEWRCMNCRKMTCEYICTHCGNESYINLENNKAAKNTLKKSESKHNQNEKDKDNDNSYIKVIDTKLNSGKKQKIISVCLVLLAFLNIVTISLGFKTKNLMNKTLKENVNLNDMISFQGEEIEILQKEINNLKEENVKYIFHEVKIGETLGSICKNYNLDYAAYKNIILSINRIDNPDIIKTSQIIMLPQVK